MSDPPPAPNELTILMVWVGYSCAAAGQANPIASAQAAAIVSIDRFMSFPPGSLFCRDPTD
jgi:hypothetical protein